MLPPPQVGSQTPTYTITSEHAELKERNDQQRKRVDDVLTNRLQMEQKTKQVRVSARQAAEARQARVGSGGRAGQVRAGRSMPPTVNIIY